MPGARAGANRSEGAVVPCISTDDVLVTQANGRRVRAARRLLVEGDALLVPGETALFVTRRTAELGWYHLVAGGESRLRAKDKAERGKLVERFAWAAAEVARASTRAATLTP